MNKYYKLIKNHYGDQVAKRSQIPLINHIDEGLVLLNRLNANQRTKDAYCIHPLIQDKGSKVPPNITGISNEVLLLAMEYRYKANSFLCNEVTDNLEITDLISAMWEETKLMLIADKVQNYKDFLIAHKDSHPRRIELDIYFNKWIKYLNVNYYDLVKLIQNGDNDDISRI